MQSTPWPKAGGGWSTSKIAKHMQNLPPPRYPGFAVGHLSTCYRLCKYFGRIQGQKRLNIFGLKSNDRDPKMDPRNGHA